MGIGPIPWNCVVQYAQFHGLEDDVSKAFVQVIMQMDGVYLEWEREEEDQRRVEREAEGRSGR